MDYNFVVNNMKDPINSRSSMQSTVNFGFPNTKLTKLS